MNNIYDIFDEIQEKKDDFLHSTFVSPILHHNFVLVKINGLIYKFKVKNSENGWFLLSPISKNSAKIERELKYFEKDEYLSLFPKVYFISLYAKDDILYSYPRGNADVRYGARNITPVLLPDLDVVDNLDVIQARFDGLNYWFEDVDFNSDPIKAEFLRGKISSFAEIEEVRFQGLTPFDKEAYSIVLDINKDNNKDFTEIMLKRMIEGVDGSKFINYIENQSQFRVRYAIDGVEQPVALVSKDDFNVISAGICLTNEGEFDLKSLVTVMKERQSLGGDPNRYAWHREWGRAGEDYYEED